MNTKLSRYLNKVGDLPTVPMVAQKVMQLVENPETSVDDLKRVIETDPAIASRILKVANSSLYGFSRSIETLAHAISLLGFRTVRSLVMAASLNQSFRHFGLTEKLLWEHAIVASTVSGALGEYGGIGIPREEAFTVGLLHDLGKIALSNCSHDEYDDVIRTTYNDGRSFADVEREVFGFDHAEIGAQVARKWKLPGNLEAAIRYHHEPESLAKLTPEEGRMTALATVTTSLCTRLGVGRRGPIEEIDVPAMPAWSYLGLKDSDWEEVWALTQEQHEHSAGFTSP